MLAVLANLSKKRVLTAGFIVLFFVIMSGFWLWNSRGVDYEKYDNLMKQAAAAHEGLLFKESLALYRQAFRENRYSMDACEAAVEVLLVKNLIGEAEAEVHHCAKTLSSSESEQLYAMLGNHYYELGDWSAASEAYSKAGGNESENFARSLIALGEFDKASQLSSVPQGIKEFLSRIDSAKASSELELATLAAELTDAELPTLVVELYSKSQDLSYWASNYYYGRALYEMGQFKEATELIEKAYVRGGDSPDLLLYLGRSKCAANDCAAILNDKPSRYYFSAISQLSGGEQEQLFLEALAATKDPELFNKFPQYIENYQILLSYMLDFADSAKYEYKDGMSALFYKILGYYFVKNEAWGDLRLLTSKYGLQAPERFYFEALLKYNEGNDVEARSLFGQAVDADMQGEITELAKRELSRMR